MGKVIHLDFNLRRRLSVAPDGAYPRPLDPSAILMYDHTRFSAQSVAAIFRIGSDLSRALSRLDGGAAPSRPAATSAIRNAIGRCRAASKTIAAEARVHVATQGRPLGFDGIVALADLQFAGSMLENLLQDEQSAGLAWLVASANDAALAMIERNQADAVAMHMAHPDLLSHFDLSVA
ncbi:MAG TPA: hypothetical protein VLF18_17090 [Tahibacter sp.]|uniref:hypothetical protein n=1 Tax=Tahibacter sp. TaxID=2056211 RepID=UPI002C208979|nr:hypothetical protein [Tahibacter sp.]HSX61907.1 hypothetical protein [Tahibacter sp.]